MVKGTRNSPNFLQLTKLDAYISITISKITDIFYPSFHITRSWKSGSKKVLVLIALPMLISVLMSKEKNKFLNTSRGCLDTWVNIWILELQKKKIKCCCCFLFWEKKELGDISFSQEMFWLSWKTLISFPKCLELLGSENSEWQPDLMLNTVNQFS